MVRKIFKPYLTVLLVLGLKALPCVVENRAAPTALGANVSKPAKDVYGDPLPPMALARMGTIRLIHTGDVFNIAYSPRGDLVAAWGGDGENAIRLWDVITGKELARLTGPTIEGPIAFSPDGKILASGSSDHKIRLWDVRHKKEIRKLLGLKDSACALVFSHDGKTLAAGCVDWTVRLWQVDTGNYLGEFVGHKQLVNSLAFSKDDKILVSASNWDGTIRLWQPATGKKLGRLGGRLTQFYHIAMAPDGVTLASGQADSLIRIWDIKARKQLRSWKASNDQVPALAFAFGGKVLVGAADDIKLWDVSTGKRLRRFAQNGPFVHCLAVSPDGKTLASGGMDWAVRLWDLTNGKEILPFQRHQDRIEAVAFFPDGKTLASASFDKTIRFWDTGSGKQKAMIRLKEGIASLAIAQDGKTLASGSYSGALRLWQVKTRKHVKDFHGHRDKVGSIAFSADGQKLASASREGSVRLWEVRTGRQIRRYAGSHHGGELCVAFSPDGKLLAFGNGNGNVRIWGVDSGKELRQLHTQGYETGPEALAFQPEGRMLAVATSPLVFWDITMGKPLRKMFDPYPGSLAFSPDGKLLATLRDNTKTLGLWEVATGQAVRRFVGHQGSVNSVAFSRDGSMLASASADMTILIWDVYAMDPGRFARPKVIGEREFQKVWDDMANQDAARAYRAVCYAINYPTESVKFLRKHMKTSPRANPRDVSSLISELKSEVFATRESASQELANLEDLAKPALESALASKPSPEVRRRVVALLKRLDTENMTVDRLRFLRAIMVLERIRSPEARALLQKLGKGARLAREAEAALNRLAKSPNGTH